MLGLTPLQTYLNLLLLFLVLLLGNKSYYHIHQYYNCNVSVQSATAIYTFRVDVSEADRGSDRVEVDCFHLFGRLLSVALYRGDRH